MRKWYENPAVDKGNIISSRVRLARNIKKYPFAPDKKRSENIAEDVESAFKRLGSAYSEEFVFTNMPGVSLREKTELICTHAISPGFAENNGHSALIHKKNHEITVMINEEDHIRMQAIHAGDDLNGAWDILNKLDDFIEESIEYAFDSKFGYLTLCPTNTGTGLRASYMVHLPLLEAEGKIKDIVQGISRFGMTVRGIYGEGTDSSGAIYQISNQITMGKSETEIIENLKRITTQIIESERSLYTNIAYSVEIQDRIYRSYGILQKCRLISYGEAMQCLSNIRLGLISGSLDLTLSQTVYEMMIHIQAGMLSDNNQTEQKTNILRANYLREVFE